jgi:hypothetical protein
VLGCGADLNAQNLDSTRKYREISHRTERPGDRRGERSTLRSPTPRAVPHVSHPGSEAADHQRRPVSRPCSVPCAVSRAGRRPFRLRESRALLVDQTATCVSDERLRPVYEPALRPSLPIRSNESRAGRPRRAEYASNVLRSAPCRCREPTGSSPLSVCR